MVTFAIISTGRGDVKMSNLFMRIMREARVKKSPAGYKYYSNWHLTKDTKRYKNLYEHINRVMKSLLYLPIVSLHKLTPQVQKDDSIKKSILLQSTTSGHNGILFVH